MVQVIPKVGVVVRLQVKLDTKLTEVEDTLVKVFIRLAEAIKVVIEITFMLLDSLRSTKF